MKIPYSAVAHLAVRFRDYAYPEMKVDFMVLTVRQVDYNERVTARN
jgi:hypothetical protein